MRIDEVLQRRRPAFSFEFFPPKTDEAMLALLDVAATLSALSPAFVSVTYGAGGSTRTRTIEVVKAIQQNLGLEAMAHLTCVGATADEIRVVLRDIAHAGIDNVLALRGDPPRSAERFEQVPGGLGHGSDLAALITAEFDFCVGGACYPEKHLEALNFESDLGYARLKVEAGARFLITQLFFDNDCYFAFVERARGIGIEVPIIPGIMPITNAEQVARFTKMCGASIPTALLTELEARRDQPEAVADFGVAYATLQCADLLARGAPGIHFYTLNKSPASRAVVSALLAARPWEQSAHARYLEGTEIARAAFERRSAS